MSKDKRYTTKQLHRARRRAQLEARADARAAKADAMRLARREARALSMFKGCDPERTLDLLGEDV